MNYNRKLDQHLRDAPRGTLQALANHLGVPYQTVQKWVSGERPLTRKDYDRAMIFLVGLNYINRRYQGSANVIYPPRFEALPIALPNIPKKTTTARFEHLMGASLATYLSWARHGDASHGQGMKLLWIIKQELLEAAGAAPTDRYAVLDYLHQA